MINTFLIFLAITDPDKVLQGLQSTLSEYVKKLDSVTNNQAIISDHQELSHLTQRLENIKRNVDFLIYEMS
tara:strand:+ start:101 stop:313 length:213 start_codon:yes stop_codon:yes gene_type:complete